MPPFWWVAETGRWVASAAPTTSTVPRDIGGPPVQQHLHDRRVGEVVVDDQVRHDDFVPQVARLIALAAGALVTILGLVALFGIDWDAAEPDSPITEIGDMTFTPVVAGATALLGVLLLAAAASRNGEGRVALGAITGCLGAAIVLADLEPRWHVTEAQGWVLVAVGIVFVLAGILDRSDTVVSRRQQVIDVR